MQELLWLLLPVAAASGWMAARRMHKQSKASCFDVDSDYFKGLNYLLNEQPDKAIEAFVRIAEVDSDTVEPHLALGSLFRRRGEVDRAIHIHQSLVARSTLSHQQRAHALFELGQDYLKAGLLDRAEDLSQELIALNEMVPSALRQLIDIYQQEQDWEKAIKTARQYDQVTGENSGEVIAHYYCELAQKALLSNDDAAFERAIKQAIEHDQGCARASMMLADKAKAKADYDNALTYYRRVVEQDVEYFPKIIAALKDCYEQSGKEQVLTEYLDSILEQYEGITPVLYRAEQYLAQDEQKAVEFMADQLSQKPSVRGLQWLLELNLSHSEGRTRKSLTILQELMNKLLENKNVYECHHCGFSGKSMHWQCPGCKQWNTVKPIKGVAAE